MQVFAETMEHSRDEEQEYMLGEIIRDGDDTTSQFLNDSGEGMEGEDNGSGDRMEEGEDDGSAGVGALIVAKSGEVYILNKPLRTD